MRVIGTSKARVREAAHTSLVSAERVPVYDIGRHRRAWLLSVEGRDAVRADGLPTCHGFGAPYPKPFSAVFVHAGCLWLQVGKHRWDVANIVDVRQDYERIKKAKYTLAFRDGSRHSVTVKFPASVAAFRILDPTHDEIESWSEDIMKMLPYAAADGWRADPATSVAEWAARVTPMWESGVRLGASEEAG